MQMATSATRINRILPPSLPPPLRKGGPGGVGSTSGPAALLSVEFLLGSSKTSIAPPRSAASRRFPQNSVLPRMPKTRVNNSLDHYTRSEFPVIRAPQDASPQSPPV